MSALVGKYDSVFIEIFAVTKEELIHLSYQGNSEWDSIGHMQLVSRIEDEFGVMFETEDIIDFSSYQKGIEILKKYNVDF